MDVRQLKDLIDLLLRPRLLAFEIVLKDLQSSSLIVEKIRTSLLEVLLHVAVLRREMQTHAFARENNEEFLVQARVTTVEHAVGDPAGGEITRGHEHRLSFVGRRHVGDFRAFRVGRRDLASADACCLAGAALVDGVGQTLRRAGTIRMANR